MSESKSEFIRVVLPWRLHRRLQYVCPNGLSAHFRALFTRSFADKTFCELPEPRRVNLMPAPVFFRMRIEPSLKQELCARTNDKTRYVLRLVYRDLRARPRIQLKTDPNFFTIGTARKKLLGEPTRRNTTMSEETETQDPVTRLRLRAERKRAEAQREREKIDALYRILPAGQPIIDARDRKRREKLLERYRRNLNQFTEAVSLEERANKLELERQQQLSARPAQTVSEIEINGVTIAQDFAANRTRVLFPEKPAENLRLQLKKAGFRWSPSEKAWQRFLSDDALNRAREIAEHFRPAV